MTNEDLMDITNGYIGKISINIKNFLKEESLDIIKSSNGKNKKSPECCKKGSFVYFLYDSKDKIIYIGESGKSVKRRLYLDGSGAHCTKGWFKDVVKIKYYMNIQMDVYTRKVLERALISEHKPKHNY